MLDSKNDTRLNELYEFYSEFFPLASERESIEGFKKILDLNYNKKYQKQISPFKETWFLMSSDNGELIAGINFSIYTFPEKIAEETQIIGSGNIIYIFVKKEYRTLGVAGVLLEKAEAYIKDWIINNGAKLKTDNILITCEMNAPELMSEEEYYTDHLYSGVNPCARIIWWHKKGYRRLAFNYAQPALSEDDTPCTSLTLNAKTPLSKINGKALYEHLKRYFEISVFKGNLPKNDVYLKNLYEYLQNNNIKICGDESYYKEIISSINNSDFIFGRDALFKHPLTK